GRTSGGAGAREVGAARVDGGARGSQRGIGGVKRGLRGEIAREQSGDALPIVLRQLIICLRSRERRLRRAHAGIGFSGDTSVKERGVGGLYGGDDLIAHHWVSRLK